MFFFKKKKAEEPRVRQPDPTAQKRSAFRLHVEFDVHYTLDGRAGSRTGCAGDLSAGGLQLRCDEDFAQGSLLTLAFKLPDDFLAEISVGKELYEYSPFGLRPETVKTRPRPFEPMTVRAKVLATFPAGGTAFTHRLAFVDLGRAPQDELQRFIHLSQVYHLRTRRGEWS